MMVRVKIARSAKTFDDLFRLRYRVYVEQGGYIPARPEQRLCDRFDAIPGTTLMVAEVEGELVGTVRFTRDLGAGTHANDFYDFAAHLPPDARVGSGSMLAVDEDWQGTPRLTSSLVGMCIYHAAAAGLTHLLGTVNPEALDGFMRFGFRAVDGILTQPSSQLPFCPVILDLGRLEGRVAAFVQRQIEHSFLLSQDRLFLAPGAQLVARVDESYYVLGGLLEQYGMGGSKLEFGPGDYVHHNPMDGPILATSKVDLLALPRHATTADIVASPYPDARPGQLPAM